MVTVENPNAGQGAVVLDIGGDIGALIVTMPAELDGVEVEIVPTGSRTRPHPSPATHDSTQHDAAPGHSHAAAAPPHVAVLARPTPGGSVIHSLVFPELAQGTYDLYIRPSGPVALTATVTGGQVTESHWPDLEAAPN